MNVDKDGFLNLVVVLMMEMHFINDCEVVVISKVAVFDMDTVEPFVMSNLVAPRLLDVRVLELLTLGMMVNLLLNPNIMAIKCFVNSYHLISHGNDLQYYYIFIPSFAINILKILTCLIDPSICGL